MPIEIKPNSLGQDIQQDERKDMLMSYHENYFHLIPCGSNTDIIPEYFKSRHPFEDDIVLQKRWSKTPRVK